MGARRTRFFLTFIYLFFSVKAFSQEWVEAYTNTRSLGMGGAQIGLTSDETSLYRNPANLGSIRNYFGALIDPELEGQANFTDLISAGNLPKAVDVENTATVLKNSPGEFYHARLQFTPSFTTRNFGFGLIYRNELNAVTDTTGSAMDTFYQNDFGAVLGINQSLFGGVVKIGASVKAFNRIEIVSATLSTAGPFDLSTVAAEGSALQYDAGIMIQVPVTLIPTLSVVGRDLGNTKFDKKDGVRARTSTTPTEVKQTIDAAISIFPIHGNRIRSTWTLEYRDAANAHEEDDQMKHVHFGTEFNFSDLFFLRAGMNQRYVTAGIELASERFSWQISSYGEEIGIGTDHKEDRRYSTKILIRY